MPKDYNWCEVRGVYRFDSSSAVIMPFLKAPMLNDYNLADDNSRINLKPVLSTF